MSAEKITYEMYNGKVKIDFYPNSHRYKVQGQKSYLISVTGATGTLDKSKVLMKWATGLNKSRFLTLLEEASGTKFTREELAPMIEDAFAHHEVTREKAASIGDKVHEFAEQFGKAKMGDGEMPEITDDMEEEVVNGISAFLDWFNQNKVEFVSVEGLVYSMAHDYTGKYDAVAKVNGTLSKIDYKTSKGIYNDHFYQLSGYWGAYEEEHSVDIDQGYILSFGKEDGKLTIKNVEREEHVEKNYPVFLSLLNVKRREKELQKEWYDSNKTSSGKVYVPGIGRAPKSK